jgi:hypothetical protein
VFGQAAPARTADVAPAASVEVIEPRSDAVLKELIDEARKAEREGERAATDFKSSYERAKGEAKIRKRDEDAVKARMELAKDEGREADRARLEKRREEVIFDRELLERQRDVHDARRKQAESQRDASRAVILALEAERDLTGRRQRVFDRGRDPALDRDYLKAERRVLELQRTAARKREQAVSREEDVVGKQLDTIKHLEERLK